jgi:hypothetical protein
MWIAIIDGRAKRARHGHDAGGDHPGRAARSAARRYRRDRRYVQDGVPDRDYRRLRSFVVADRLERPLRERDMRAGRASAHTANALPA